VDVMTSNNGGKIFYWQRNPYHEAVEFEFAEYKGWIRLSFYNGKMTMFTHTGKVNESPDGAVKAHCEYLLRQIRALCDIELP
jgi:hypothetical protein